MRTASGEYNSARGADDARQRPVTPAMKYRTERDPLGERQVPADARYGIQTQRALENFPISGLTAAPDLVTATVIVKRAAAVANRALGRLPAEVADAIIAAADEVIAGDFRDQFVVDVY